MEKPMEMKMAEYKRSLVELVNAALKEIPAAYVADALYTTMLEANNIAKEQLVKAQKEYFDSLAESEEKELKEEAKSDEA